MSNKTHKLLEKKLSPMAAIDLLIPNFHEIVKDPDFFSFDAIIIENIDFEFKDLIFEISRIINVSYEKIVEDTNKRESVYSRQICMTMAMLYTKFSTTIIGLQLAGRDHATVLHAKKVVLNMYDTDRKKREELDLIIARLNLITKTHKSLDYLR